MILKEGLDFAVVEYIRLTRKLKTLLLIKTGKLRKLLYNGMISKKKNRSMQRKKLLKKLQERRRQNSIGMSE